MCELRSASQLKAAVHRAAQVPPLAPEKFFDEERT
jgi:hypothetical protein